VKNDGEKSHGWGIEPYCCKSDFSKCTSPVKGYTHATTVGQKVVPARQTTSEAFMGVRPDTIE